MPELEPLKAVQLSAKLAHAWRRLRTIELEVRQGLPTGPSARYRTVLALGQEYSDVMRYLRGIEDELTRSVARNGATKCLIFRGEPSEPGLR